MLYKTLTKPHNTHQRSLLFPSSQSYTKGYYCSPRWAPSHAQESINRHPLTAARSRVSMHAGASGRPVRAGFRKEKAFQAAKWRIACWLEDGVRAYAFGTPLPLPPCSRQRKERVLGRETERERDTTAALRREFRGECRVERASGMESRVFLSSPLAGARRVVLHTCSTVGARAGLGESHQ